ncbi:MAG: hypothetical protein G01um101466_122 [Parcubacteria group bacterium Gr01-1014_66]|nr:MAG: hypothetical protein G01um101466_122 [Parcubacteria group bacterium Gr01-1014_66]
MIIQWYGQACIRIQSGDLVIACDPFGKEIGLTAPRFRADLIMVTHSHYDHAHPEQLAGTPFLITTPGEYEIKEVSIRGIPSYHDTNQGKERGLNTIYAWETEDIRLAHLGDFGEAEMREDTLEHLGTIDILFVPVGGVYTIDGKTAGAVVRQIEPAIAIPIHYRIPGLTIKLDDAASFLKEMGAAGVAPEEKLVIRKKDLGDAKELGTRVVVLKPQSSG